MENSVKHAVRGVRRWTVRLATLVLAAGTGLGLKAAVLVSTLGGGPIVSGGPTSGFQDGFNAQQPFSQFNNPAGLAVDSNGVLWIADRNNNAIRKMIPATTKVTTVWTNGPSSPLSSPVAVAVDSGNNVYVANAGNGTVQKFDRFGFLAFTWSGLLNPAAMVLDTQTNLLVVETNGFIKKLYYSDTTGVATTRTLVASNTVAGGLVEPQGIALLDSGLVAVSEAGANRVTILNPINGWTVSRVIGSGTAGWRDGPANVAMLNRPHQVAKAPNGSLIVADRGNHRVRMISTDNIVQTVYGIDSSQWFVDPSNTAVYPGWWDDTSEFAEAREPVGVAVGSDGSIYVTESYYSLVRVATGAGVGGSGPGGGGTGGPSAELVLPPTFTPVSGYYPMGTVITVVNPNTNSFFNNRVVYTTDGTDPNTNSLEVVGGQIVWRETAKDLSSLKVRAFSGTTGSTVVSGQTSGVNQVGVPREAIAAGVGQTLILPVVTDLIQNTVLKSVQFLVEVVPQTNGARIAPALQFPIRTLPMSPGDYISVKASATNEPTTIFTMNGTTAQLAISYVGTNAGFSASGFGVVTMLALPMPVTSLPGDAYAFRVSLLSGTSDGLQTTVPLTNMPSRLITVTANLTYLVGDSAPSGWYNAEVGGAGTFGDAALNNPDVNNAFYASLGVRVPYEASDAFDAMDAFPVDSAFAVGGDLRIRFLDWQYILLRSLGLRTDDYLRAWGPGGVRTVVVTNATPKANSPAPASISMGVQPWSRQVLVGASAAGNVNPGETVSIPIFVKVGTGSSVAGMQFRVRVTPENGGPGLTEALSFQKSSGVPAASQSTATSASDLLLGWNLGSFSPALHGSNAIGYIVMKVPANAADGATYRLSFLNADGSPDLNTQYDWESLSALVGVRTAVPSAGMVSDDWKMNYFGSLTNPLAQDASDPDGDGMTNSQEYQGGTNPAELRLRILTASNGQSGPKFQWFGRNGTTIALEASDTAVGNNWTVLTSAAGNDGVTEFQDAGTGSGSRFYRLRTVP